MCCAAPAVRRTLRGMLRQGSIRASDADRDEAVERLRHAAGEGRLDPHELDDRVRRALVAVTYADLAVLVRDLPTARDARSALTVQRRAAVWTWRTARTHPGAIVVLIPLVVVVGTVLLTMAVVSLVLVAIAMAVGAQAGGRRRRHTAASIS
jgi:Domain of unknown function (DUF1707)